VAGKRFLNLLPASHNYPFCLFAPALSSLKQPLKLLVDTKHHILLLNTTVSPSPPVRLNGQNG
jgi:hypothetical protein